MKRSVFLQRLAALVGLSVALPAAEPEKKAVPLLRFHVRGFRYYDGPALLPQLHKGDGLRLVREPENRYDAAAIALYYGPHKLGFVPAERNQLLSRLLDEGALPLEAEILDLHPDGPPWEAVEAGISYKQAA